MKTITEEQARHDLRSLLEHAATAHEPVQINGENASAVLIGEEDWRSIEETLFLVSVPGMRESILTGLKTPVSDCSSSLPW